MKKRILFVISNTEIGGPQKSLIGLFDTIDYDKYEVYLYSIKPYGRLEKYYNKNVIRLEHDDVIRALMLPSNEIIKSFKVLLKNKKYKAFIMYVLLTPFYYFIKSNMNLLRQKVWKYNKEKISNVSDTEFDIGYGILGQSTYLLCDVFKCNVKYHWIRSDVRILNRNKKIDKYYYELIDGVIAVSKETLTIFENEFPNLNLKKQVMYNLIPFSFYNRIPGVNIPKGKGILIVSVMRLERLKGLDLIIDTAKELKKLKINFSWYIVGDGKLKDKFMTELIENKLNSNFYLLGYQLNPYSILKQCDIFVHPSRSEGKSNSIDEAKMIPMPIVVTNFPTVGEQIKHNYTGLISEMNGQSIAKNIVIFKKNKEMKNYCKKNCLLEKKALCKNGILKDGNDLLIKTLN